MERRSVEEDARLKQIVLTDSAWKIAEAMKQNCEEMEQQLTRGFSEEEKQQLTGYLNRILDNLHEESEVNED